MNESRNGIESAYNRLRLIHESTQCIGVLKCHVDGNCIHCLSKPTMKDETGRHAVEWYGSQNQDFIAMEEMGELITALSHFKRGRIPSEAVCEEIADVLVALESLKHTYGEDRVGDYFQQKKNRLIMRIGLEMATQKPKP